MSVGNHAERGADGRYLSAQNEHKGKNKTSDVIARDFGVGKETVKRAEHFLDGLNEAEKEQKPYFSTKFRKTPLKGGKA